MVRLGCWLLLATLSLLSASIAPADESRPFYIELTALPADSGEHFAYKLQWRIPPSVRVGNRPRVVLPDFCIDLNAASPDSGAARPAAIALSGESYYRCRQALSGQTLTLHYPGYNPSVSSLIKYHGRSGEQYTQMLSPSVGQWQVPAQETKTSVAIDYTRLGIEHILIGIDHLLFVVCLLWIAGSLRRILITITGFTVAHSLTLGLSALGIIRLPVPPVEAVIALSIVFLATEIAKHRRDSLTWRRPIAVSSSFGLLHGLGFAAALDEIGLPQTELVSGLLFFNIGVEIGQVVFAVALLGAVALFRRALLAARGRSHQLPASWQQGLRLAAIYPVGCLASFWLVERCIAFIPG